MKKSTRLTTMALATGITITSLAGCNSFKKDYVLEGTLLDKTIVASVDGDIAIVRPESSAVSCLGYLEDLGIEKEHKHYFDITTGLWMTNSEDCVHSNGVLKGANIEEIGSIVNYLTEDELQYAYDNVFTKHDVVTIISRINKSETSKEEENTLTKTK